MRAGLSWTLALVGVGALWAACGESHDVDDDSDASAIVHGDSGPYDDEDESKPTDAGVDGGRRDAGAVAGGTGGLIAGLTGGGGAIAGLIGGTTGGLIGGLIGGGGVTGGGTRDAGGGLTGGTRDAGTGFFGGGFGDGGFPGFPGGGTRDAGTGFFGGGTGFFGGGFGDGGITGFPGGTRDAGVRRPRRDAGTADGG